MSTPDPVDVAVIAARLASICREMGETMLRTSRSPIFSEARDFTTAVFDAGPRLLAQTIYIPNIAASTPFAARAVASRFGARARRGDLYVLNDPFRGNNHPPDLNVLAPVFAGDVLAFWVLAKGHQADIGGGGVVGYKMDQQIKTLREKTAGSGVDVSETEGGNARSKAFLVQPK